MSQDTHVGEMLSPVLNAIEGARTALMVVAMGVLLLWGGAKLERYLMKQRLAVVDGGTDGGRS